MGKHGMVKAVGTHFEYEDGTYYYPFGTTIYALAHQSEELIDKTMATLRKSPFNKVRMCVFPKHYQYMAIQGKFCPQASVNPLDPRFIESLNSSTRPLPTNNPITAMGWGDQPHAVESRIVYDEDGKNALLLDLKTAVPTDGSPLIEATIKQSTIVMSKNADSPPLPDNTHIPDTVDNTHNPTLPDMGCI